MKIRPILQRIVEDQDYEKLPANWASLDTASFSKSKTLWRFQEEALRNAIKTVYLYYVVDRGSKRRFYNRYRANGLDAGLERILDIRASKIKRSLLNIIGEFYPVENDRIGFYNFVNRASFWMATGSGKTLIIVKLIEILNRLIQHGEIPKKDILVLTHRDDLIKQLKRHVDEFNELAIQRKFKINLVELTEYDRVKRESLIPYLNEVTVFYYRSDLISDEQKEKLIDFRNYENNGNWYIILDEAHKGDKEESKRQMLYSIMSRNGFLFSFSATFTDPRDIVTTAYNFNLEKFIREGYGKHIYILRQELRAFREKEDYNRREKQKIILKALVLLTYIKKVRETIKSIAGDIYHEPLMMVLVNTVNLSESKHGKPDLKLFFEELERIAKGDVNTETLEQAKKELLQEFSDNPKLVYEDDEIHVDKNMIERIRIRDILRHVYNSESFGPVEAILVPGERREAIFKLKTSHRPFALIRIGDAYKWIKDNLRGYEIVESYEDKSIFENLDEREDISILMGSRAFYEGWDSNRPNIILFINIGVGKEARKFVIQSVGRGVRIEPVKGKRRRLRNLYNKGEDNGLYELVGRYTGPIETLFVMGTNRNALYEVITALEMEEEVEQTISLRKNVRAEKHVLLIPVFRRSTRKLYQEGTPMKFTVQEALFDALKQYFTVVNDKILIVQNNLTPSLLSFIRKSFSEKEKYYKIAPDTPDIPLHIAVRRLIDHFSLEIEELGGFKLLEDEIVHFRKIRISLDKEESEKIRRKLEKIWSVGDIEAEKRMLREKLENGEITIDEYTSRIIELSRMSEERFRELRIKYVANHYYIPLIMTENEKIKYIKHIIKTRSEAKFIEDLEAYIKDHGNKVNVDWWMFSKIDEYLDEIYIPYYDPESNRIRKFKPDFIFWIGRGNDYFIVFVDPKGTKHTDFERKVDWFRRFFGDIDKPKTFRLDNMNVRVLLYLYTDDRNKLSEGYRKYWLDTVEDIFKAVEKLG